MRSGEVRRGRRGRTRSRGGRSGRRRSSCATWRPGPRRARERSSPPVPSIVSSRTRKRWRISRAASKSSRGEMVTFTDYRRKPSQTGRLIRFRLTPRSLKTSAPFNHQPCTHTFFVRRPASRPRALGCPRPEQTRARQCQARLNRAARIVAR